MLIVVVTHNNHHNVVLNSSGDSVWRGRLVGPRRTPASHGGKDARQFRHSVFISDATLVWVAVMRKESVKTEENAQVRLFCYCTLTFLNFESIKIVQ